MESDTMFMSWKTTLAMSNLKKKKMKESERDRPVSLLIDVGHLTKNCSKSYYVY